MHIRLIAVGDRQPTWAVDAFGIYTGRFPRQWKFRLDSIATVRRTKNDKPGKAIEAESEKILAKTKSSELVILLDEKGQQMTSPELAGRIEQWQSEGCDVCCVIGGPDGVSSACRERADFVWSLSKLTLPHGLARVLFAEQMYRAWSLQTGHPYHRE